MSITNTCQRGKTMTDGLKTIEGNIASINTEKRLMAIEDRNGIIFYSVSWLQPQDQKIQKLRVGYYVKLTVEVKGDSSTIQAPTILPGRTGTHRPEKTHDAGT